MAIDFKHSFTNIKFLIKIQHIDLWVDLMWTFLTPDADWAMAGAFFCPAVMDDNIRPFWSNGLKYPVAFNEHLVFHKNWEQYNPYVMAILSNFQALRYVSNVDDYHSRFPTYNKIPLEGC